MTINTSANRPQAPMKTSRPIYMGGLHAVSNVMVMASFQSKKPFSIRRPWLIFIHDSSLLLSSSRGRDNGGGCISLLALRHRPRRLQRKNSSPKTAMFQARVAIHPLETALPIQTRPKITKLPRDPHSTTPPSTSSYPATTVSSIFGKQYLATSKSEPIKTSLREGLQT